MSNGVDTKIEHSGLPPSYGVSAGTPSLKRKVFSEPFHLVFKRVDDQAITWIEVKTLDGLKSVVDRLGKGEIVPVNGYSSLQMQLWGLLAERIGFLRFEGPELNGFNAGIQPLGTEQSEFAGDMTDIFGGFEQALEAISDMRDKAVQAVQSAEPAEIGDLYLKDDGVNLTPSGEEELAKQVYGDYESGNVHVKMETANAEVLLSETDTEDSQIGDEIAEIDARGRELRTISGAEAEDQGRRVERAAEGALENEEDEEEEEEDDDF